MSLVGYFKMNRKVLISWLVVSGLFFEKYYEMAILLCVLLLIIKDKSRITFNKNVLFFILILALYSLFCLCFVNYEYDKFIQQILLLSYFILCYSAILNFFRGKIDFLFDKYLIVAYVISILGLIQFLVFFICEINIFHFVYGRPAVEAANGILRITSIVDEPSYLSTLLTPALAYYILKGFFPLNIKKLVLATSIFLTFSTITYLIVVLMLFYKYVYLKNKYTFYSIILLFVLLLSISENVNIDKRSDRDSAFSAIKMKIQDTYEGLIFMDPDVFETLNMSSYATMTNLWVAVNAPNRLIGTGLGTHEQNYHAQYDSGSIYYGLNATDGYSLANRIYSEFGIIGITCFFIWLYRNFNTRNLVNMAAFFLVLTLVLRGGNYVRYGFVFWMFLYYHTHFSSFSKDE